ncbi:MAG: nodulation protein NfeD [Actinobacteria bacterium]|nr:nodulation protein NfeD [Actinomycetota bacterium]
MVSERLHNARSLASSYYPRQSFRGLVNIPFKHLFLTFILALMLIVAFFASTTLAYSEKRVFVADIEGVIDPAIAEYVNSSVKTAERANAEALVIRMDTPGGLDTSMRLIIKDIFNSEVPVIVYVSPSGARAASAGTFITLAAHVAAMTPGTNIGAAHPVNLSGEMPKEIEEKVVNDSVAYIKGIARKTNRNEKWAEDAVRKSASITAEKALEIKVVDYIAPDLKSLLSKIDGKPVKTTAGSIVLKTKEAKVVEYPMSLRQRILHILADPTLAYLLLMLGFYALIYEFANPGLGFSGIGGIILIVLGMYSLQVVPVNYAGLALIILGIGLLIAEAFSPSFGVLGAGGIISMTIGSFVLFESPVPGLRVSPYVIIPTMLTTAAFVMFATRMAVRARKQKPITGMEAMVGMIGEVRKKLNPRGEIFIRGELWAAESLEGAINEDERVRVMEVDGLRLKVKRLTEDKTTIGGKD